MSSVPEVSIVKNIPQPVSEDKSSLIELSQEDAPANAASASRNDTSDDTASVSESAGEDDARAGVCALVGRPNVGKSSLLNALIGEKLAITADVPQATRSCLLGIFASADPPTQIGFLDTPGLRRSRDAIGGLLSKEMQAGLERADVVVMLTDVRPRRTTAIRLLEGEEDVLERIKRSERKALLAINKVDTLKDKTALLPLMQFYQSQHPFLEMVPLSAQRGINLDRLIGAIRKTLPQGRLYEDDQLTDRPLRYFAAEFVREALIARMHDELPYQLTVHVEHFEETPRMLTIHTMIVVARESQKGMVIGKRGEMLKAVGIDARKAMEQMTGRRVLLRLWVKVIPGWQESEDQARQLFEAI